MRLIKEIILHCSGTDVLHDINDVISWHKNRGFKTIGYHFFIDQFGVLFDGRDIEEIGAHAIERNKFSIGICLAGEKIFSNKQFETLANLLNSLKVKYNLNNDDIYGHCFYNENKTCPNFDIDFFKNLYLKEGNQ